MWIRSANNSPKRFMTMTEDPNIIHLNGGVAIDDRGSVRFVNDFNFDGVKRFYQVQNHEKGFVRAWHGHLHEGKYVYVAQGAALIGAVRMEHREYLEGIGADALITPEGEAQRFVLTSTSPKILWIPPGYANGFMSLTDEMIIQYFSTKDIKESLGDDIRFPYDKWDIWNIEKR